jgi:hypothetical protein
MSVCKECVGTCQRGMAMRWYNQNFNKLLIGYCGTPIAIGVISAVVVHDPFLGAFGAAGGYIGTMVVELIGSHAELKDRKRDYYCTQTSKNHD